MSNILIDSTANLMVSWLVDFADKLSDNVKESILQTVFDRYNFTYNELVEQLAQLEMFCIALAYK